MTIPMGEICGNQILAHKMTTKKKLKRLSVVRHTQT